MASSPRSRARRLATGVGCALLLLFAWTASPTGARAEEEGDVEAALGQAAAIEADVMAACRQVRRASVSVAHKRFPRKGKKIIEGKPAQTVAVGSGVLIERKGRPWVVTNVHVVQGADAIDVITIDGKVHPCELHDAITLYDIALLSFVDRPRGLRPVKIGPRPSRNIQVGAWVVATGNPFSLAMDGRPVVTLGVLSGKDRILGGQYFYGNALQHDAPVNPGNSGGPLWDLRGNLIGINGKIASWSRFRGARATNTGASYSLPIYQVSEFLTALIARRTDARAGFLGLDVETVTDDEGNAIGARVTGIHEKSPVTSSRTALAKGDIVTSVFFMQAWHRIRTGSDLTNLLALGSSGDFLKVKYRRGRNSYSWQGRLR